MYRVLVLCHDASLREQAIRCLHQQGFHVVSTLPAEAIVAVHPVLTSAQRECLQAYVDCGSMRQAAQRRGCSVNTMKNHLREARRRLGVRNCAQLVCLAHALGLVEVVHSRKVPENWHKSAIDARGGRNIMVAVTTATGG